MYFFSLAAFTFMYIHQKVQNVIFLTASFSHNKQEHDTHTVCPSVRNLIVWVFKKSCPIFVYTIFPQTDKDGQTIINIPPNCFPTHAVKNIFNDFVFYTQKKYSTQSSVFVVRVVRV